MKSSPAKRLFSPGRQELSAMLAVSRGARAADMLIKGGKILDLVTGKLITADIALSGRFIAAVGAGYSGKKVIDAKGLTLVPGFIDSHLHIESSLMHPFEFERLTLPLGTTTVVCDPHEITNVMGAQGFAWFLRCAELLRQHFFVQVSSCVPALPGFETNGGQFPLEEMLKFKSHPHILGLAEMMNFPGVVKGDDEVLDKIEAFSEMNLDGHAPLLRGKDLNAYLCAGIQNCHETVSREEGLEKLQKGMAVILREGSVAKNLLTLAPLVNEFSSPQCLLCTDDRNPYEIFEEGHLNFVLKKLMKKGRVAPHVAYRLASFSAAKHFGMKRQGLIAPGYVADLVFLENLKEVRIQQVMVSGQKVVESELKKELPQKLEKSQPPLFNTMKRALVTAAELAPTLGAGTYRVIGIIENEIVTKHLQLSYDGKKFAQKDVLPIAVVERYGHAQPVAHGLVQGCGLTRGAIASSVAHDSHNIIVIGASAAEMALAVNTLLESGGGFCVVEGEKVLAHLPLPMAGLMSMEGAPHIVKHLKALKKAYARLGGKLHEPFLQMAFLALPVIPELKITDQGLVDVEHFALTSLSV